ncbi:hypothetical protein RS130_02650 [Paraglaciecola aquimarina]|uniref:GH16 domain-containing protein n=1 Tax=Paraglaciecola aquimarina TaxID=1235557 RepID=A0ABU3SSM7_9ALTE|nr:hypothetical protein [Paraglaciecola aquimarina]MDU0352972.1 hypothetical protein [Paraglaciecola aquimarina]
MGLPYPKDCNDRYGLELDIQESIGREGDFDGKIFAKGMHSNGHFWYADCDGKMQDLRSPKVTFKKNNFASDSFNTYGGWWHNESSASFYFNDGAPKFMRFYSQVKDKPFDQPMGVNLVSETYPFPWVELPNSQELADPTKNVAYYDWVRAYLLIDANSASTHQDNSLPTPPIYAESIQLHLDSATLIDSNKVEILTEYKTNQRRILNIELKDQQGAVVASHKTLVNPGFAFVSVKLIAAEPLPINQTYSVTSTIWAEKDTNKQQVLFQQTAGLFNVNTLHKQNEVSQGLAQLAITELETVKLTQAQGVYHFDVLDNKNQSVLQGITYDNTIDVSSLSKGAYAIKLDGIQLAKFTIP